MPQPEWKILYSTDYSCVYEDSTGVFAPEMVVAQEYEDQGETKFQVYRFVLERCKTIEDTETHKVYLLPYAYAYDWPHPFRSYDEWFHKDLHNVAESVGSSVQALRVALCSEIIGERAWAYEAIGGYHGFDNLDSYPRTLTEEEWDKYTDKKR